MVEVVSPLRAASLPAPERRARSDTPYLPVRRERVFMGSIEELLFLLWQRSSIPARTSNRKLQQDFSASVWL